MEDTIEAKAKLQLQEDATEAKAKMRTAKRTHLIILREEDEGLTQTDVSC